MEKSLFQKLFEINVNEKVEKKANLSYLSWAWAWAEVKKVDPNASSVVHEFPLPGADGITVPYLQTPTGYFVKVSVTIHGHTETEWLPVMDHRNKTMMEPTAFDINKNTKRCFVKAIALHGLGLYIYAGEDLPEIQVDPIEPKQVGLIKVNCKSIATLKKVDDLEVLRMALGQDTATYETLTTLSKEQATKLLDKLDKWRLQAEEKKEPVTQ